jgi:[ribosomal protein S5]-alanine N-acetyltransferase
MAPGRATGLRRRLRALRDPVLRSARLEIVLPRPATVPELVAMMADPRIARWTLSIPSPYRRSDARAFLRHAERSRTDGSSLVLQLLRRRDGALVGGIGLHHLDPVEGQGEIGYGIGRPFRGQGLAREATDAVCRFAFRRLGFHRVEARIAPGNSASARVVRAAGFRREGRLRDSVVKAGLWRDEVVYARLRTDRTRARRSSTRRVARPARPRRGRRSDRRSAPGRVSRRPNARARRA